jgi:hypothetical protein
MSNQTTQGPFEHIGRHMVALEAKIAKLEADNALLRAFVVADDCLMNSHTQSRADHLRHITEYKSARVALDAAGVLER